MAWFNVVTLQKYSQTAAPYPRLLDSVGDSVEREGDRDVEKGCCTGTHKAWPTYRRQGQIRMCTLPFSLQPMGFSIWAWKWSVCTMTLLVHVSPSNEAPRRVMCVLLMKCKHALLQEDRTGGAAVMRDKYQSCSERGGRLIRDPKHVFTRTDRWMDRQTGTLTAWTLFQPQIRPFTQGAGV